MRIVTPALSRPYRSQNRAPIQTLEEARDTVQTLHVGRSYIVTGSVDGHVRTYDLRMGELRTDFIGRMSTSPSRHSSALNASPSIDPVTAIVPSQDNQTYLVTTIDGHVRLMDMSTGKMLNDFKGHASGSYRIRACFGHGEASVLCGDEDGAVWAWDLVDVRLSRSSPVSAHRADADAQAAPLQPNPPPKVHHKVITWTEHHPAEAGELVTASADGTVKVWRSSA